MDLVGHFIFAMIEEDNPQRGFFHVRPLLTKNGAVPPQTLQYFGDEGYIRVVPDKNEKFTFKDRMRALGPVCLINLKDFPPDAHKIRPNQKYEPLYGETHQYIIYSDAVQTLPATLVYEVVAKKDGATPTALTPCLYLRQGGKIEGPFQNDNLSPADDLRQLAPDCGSLYAARLPSGEERIFYWPHDAQEDAPAPEESAKAPQTAEPAAAPQAAVPEASEAPLPETSARDHIRAMDQALEGLENRLHDAPAFPVPPMQQRPDARPQGTPIYRTQNRFGPQAPQAHNPLNAVVGRMTRDTRMEAPGATVDAGAAVHCLHNPVDAFQKTLEQLWPSKDGQEQIICALMRQPGAEDALLRAMDNGEGRRVRTLMQSQLEDMEAERLALVMQLEKASQKKEALFKEALDAAENKLKSTLSSMEDEQARLAAAMEQSKNDMDLLLQERDRLLAQMEQLGGLASVLAPEEGEVLPLRDAMDQVLRHVKNAGFACTVNDAKNILLLLAVCRKIELRTNTDSPADALTLANALADALGAATLLLDEGQTPTYLAGGSGPAFALTRQGSLRPTPYHELLLDPKQKAEHFALAPWPRLFAHTCSLPQQALPQEDAVSLNALFAALSDSAGELPQAARHHLSALNAYLVKEHGRALPLCVIRDMTRYMTVAAEVLDGGIAAAMDYAMLSFVLPWMDYQGISMPPNHALIAGLTLTQQALQCK